MERANCRNQAPNVRRNPNARDPWFPGKGHSQNPGKIACFTCPVRDECADYRDRTGSKYGMWAGDLSSKDDEDAD